MAATTISRATWTDGASGTLLNNARLQADVYDKIDSLIAGAITFGGLLLAEGFGEHGVIAAGTGNQLWNVRNTSAGTTNAAGVVLGNDTASNRGTLIVRSTTFTSSVYTQADGVDLSSRGAGGLNLAADNAAGVIRFFAGGTTERLRVTAGGRIGIGTTTPDEQVAINVGDAAYSVTTSLSNRAFFGGWQNACVISSNRNPVSGTFTDTAKAAAQIKVTGEAANGLITFETTGSNNTTPSERMRISKDGQVLVGTGSAAEPVLAASTDTDTGLYWDGSDGLFVTLGGTARVLFSGTTAVGAVTYAAGAAAPGPMIGVGRNTSGAGAAGRLSLVNLGGTQYYLWVDASGNFRIHTTTPVEGSGDTSGTVVGTQSSCLASKDLLGEWHDTDASLTLIRATPLHRFKYKDGRFRESDFMGVVTDFSPAFGMDEGRSLNTPSAIGHLFAAIKALAARLEAVEAR
jgi:hypothetical protein